MLLRDRRGYSMTFWAVFIGLGDDSSPCIGN